MIELVPKKERRYIQCQHCSIYYPIEKVHLHEEMCSKNILQSIKKFNSLGKKFMEKPKKLTPFEAPIIRVACITVEGRSHPMLLDDALIFLKQSYLYRAGSFRNNKVNLQCFVVRDYLAFDIFDNIWNAIEKARKAGARLI